MATVLGVTAIIVVALIGFIVLMGRLVYRTQVIGAFQIFLGVLGLLSAVVLGYFVVYYYTSSIKVTWDDIQSKKVTTVFESTDTKQNLNVAPSTKESTHDLPYSEELDKSNNSNEEIFDEDFLHGSSLLVIIIIIGIALSVSEKLFIQKEQKENSI